MQKIFGIDIRNPEEKRMERTFFNKNKKRIFSIIMIIVMLSLDVDMTAFAANYPDYTDTLSGNIVNNKEFEKNDNSENINEEECNNELGEDEPIIPANGSVDTTYKEGSDTIKRKIEWEIDGEGNLTVSGEGTPSYNNELWRKYKNSIKTVKLNNVTKIESLDNFFYSLDKVESIQFTNCDFSNVTDLSYLFSGCLSLKELDLSVFKNVKITNMEGAFQKCSSLTGIDLSMLDTSRLTNAKSLFYDCKKITSIDLTGWNVRYVRDMSNMFYDCYDLYELKLFDKEFSYVSNIEGMFKNCSSIEEIDLDDWETPRVTSLNNLFSGCESLESLKAKNLFNSNITDMSYTFEECAIANDIDFSEIDTSNVTNMSGMFSGCNLYGMDLSLLDTSNVTDMSSMFYNCTNLKEFPLGKMNLSSVRDMVNMFASCEFVNIKFPDDMILKDVDLYGMFSGSKWLKSVDFSNTEFTNVDLSRMFSYCERLVDVNMRNAVFKDVTSISGMFSYCRAIETIDLSNISFAENTLYARMWELFSFCVSLKRVILPNCINNPLVIDDSDDVDIYTYGPFVPFYHCSSLESVDLSNLRIKNESDFLRTDLVEVRLFCICDEIKTIIFPTDSDVILFLPEDNKESHNWYAENTDEPVENKIDCSSGKSIVLTRDEKKIINRYVITVDESENGKVLIDNIEQKSLEVFEGAGKKIIIIPNENYYVKDVIIDGKSIGAVNSYEFKDIVNNHTVKVLFSNKKNIRVSVEGSGKVIPYSEENNEVEIGKNITYKFIPDSGNTVKSVKVDGKDIGAVDTYEFTDVKENHSLEVQFIQNRFMVNFDPCKGTVDTEFKECDISQKYGLLPVPEYSGHIFNGWYTSKTSGVKITADSIFDFEEDITLYARWDNITLAVNQKYSVLGFFPMDLEICKFAVIKVDEGKATISKKGILKAKKPGRVKIVPCIKDGKKVKMLEDKAVTVTIKKVSFSEKKLILKPGAEIDISRYLKEVPTNSNTVSYSVAKSKKPVAQLDRETATLKALKTGKTKVTATITNNQGESCKVSMKVIVEN